MLQQLIKLNFEVKLCSHAAAILEKDFPAALTELEAILSAVSIPIFEIIGSGGGEAKGTQRMRHQFTAAGWSKGRFEIKKIINGAEKESISHEVDHVKEFPAGCLALEIEWNNKDPFFDRDLENFKRLHAEGAISVGTIVTRGASLHKNMRQFVRQFAKQRHISSFKDLESFGVVPTSRQRENVNRRVERENGKVDFATAWSDFFVSDKYGEATTHWRKLLTRIARGVGNPCPLLLIGLPDSIVSFEESHAADP